MTIECKVSLITATYNAVDTLTDCFESVKKQYEQPYEHIVIDGSSKDGTVGIIQKWVNNPNLFISEKDGGIYDALNKGLRIATGDVIGFLNADDMYSSSDSLAKIVKAFEDHTVCAVYGNLNYVDKFNTLKVIRRWRGSRFERGAISLGWMPAHPTLYVRRGWYLRIRGFDTRYQISSDYHSVIKLFGYSDFKTVYLDENLVTMRLGGVSNKSIKNIIQKTKEDWLILRASSFSIISAVIVILFKNLKKLSQFI